MEDEEKGEGGKEGGESTVVMLDPSYHYFSVAEHFDHHCPWVSISYYFLFLFLHGH